MFHLCFGVLFMHFLELTYWQDATVPVPIFCCFLFQKSYKGNIRGIDKGSYLKWFHNRRLQKPEDELEGSHRAATPLPGTGQTLGRAWLGCGPPSLHLLQGFCYYFQIYILWSFRSFRELLFLHINNTMAILLKTTSVWVSSIQIMQVRVQNKGKSVWKSRYDGDVSTPPSLNLCLSSRNSVDKLKVIKKNFYKLGLLLLL